MTAECTQEPHRQPLATGMNPQRILIHAAAFADACGTYASPGAILVEADRIVAAGPPQDVGEVPDAQRLDATGSLVIPALVNAHAHLDLSHIGPIEFDGDFTRWVDRLRNERARSPEGIAEAVRLGARLAQAGGTALIGDIAGVRSTVPTFTLREQGLGGASFLEVFGVGRSQSAAIEVMRAAVDSMPALEHGVRFGLQPHAPYSCGPDVYQAAVAMAQATHVPLSTHLAETLEEITFVDRAEGPLADMLRRLGVWDDTIAAFGEHPIDHIAALLGSTPCIAAHLNYVEDQHIDLLARSRITVAYCPRASAYFGHHGSGHRYHAMLAAGINVTLGTDSILCLDTPERISVLDDMRLLWRRDGVEPLTLLRMATVNGARALGARESLFSIAPGQTAGLIAVEIDRSNERDPLVSAMLSDAPPRWIVGPIAARNEWFESK